MPKPFGLKLSGGELSREISRFEAQKIISRHGAQAMSARLSHFYVSTPGASTSGQQ